MNLKVQNTAIKIIVSFIFLTLVSCGGSGSNGDTNTSVDQKITTEIPTALQSLILNGSGTLTAYIIIDDDAANRIAMTIDTIASTASTSIPGLSQAMHKVVISYEYTDGMGAIVLAALTRNIDLTSGSVNLNFVANDYDMASYDADGDGVSNAAELAAGTDPRDKTCVLNTSVLGSCTLG